MVSKEDLKSFFTVDKYKVELFEREGFMRKQCKVCKKHFWTLDADAEVCGDTECVGEYEFLGNKTKNWDFHETIKRMTDFFVRNGHTAIREYSVVARWRDDMDFTIASIALFQPYVLSGVVDPPANPLVVAQPCLRFGGEFNDLDNIGKTGRHLTSFIMFGQHAFNSDRLKGYWMDECIDLNFRFLTEEMGIPKEEINYGEGIWMGGGNFGPNLEAYVRGSELVNNVFMQYEVLPDGNFREMDMTVIDVGWGAERISWFTQGTPTIYEATFPHVLDWLKKETGVSVDEKLLFEYARHVGFVNLGETTMENPRLILAEKLGLDWNEFQEIFGPLEALYAIADHSRSLVFATADSAIPSNVGGGHNLRILLRRILSLSEKFGFTIDFHELFDKQIEYFSKTYKRVENAKDLIHVIFDVERRRYEKALALGKQILLKKARKSKKLTINDLVELYDSRGMNPEMVLEIMKKENLNVDIELPSNFYQVVGELQEKRRKKSKKVEKKKVVDFKTTKSTHPLYYDDRYMKEADARVLEKIDKFVILDQTIFYPTGGGQIHDTGTIIDENGNEYKVVDVFKEGGVIIHELDKELPDNVKKVHCKLDWERRYTIMRHHTAVHVVNNAAKKVLGNHVWQEGADKTPEKARLDISHYESLSREQIKQIEYWANRAVIENKKVNIQVLERTKAEELYGVTIYQGGAVPGKYLRIIDIEGWDVEACGGTHLDMTGEIGFIKIINAERIQDGVVRLEMVAGEPAIRHVQYMDDLLHESASILKIDPDQLPKTARRFFDEWKQYRKEIDRLNREIAELLLDKIESKIIDKNGVKILAEVLNKQPDLVREMLLELMKKHEKESLIALLISNYNGKLQIFGGSTNPKQYPVNKIVARISKELGGGGGGKPDFAQGGGTDLEKMELIAPDLLKFLDDLFVTQKTKK